jgi:hypothetical protein
MKVNDKEFLILETHETKHMGLNINLVINFKGIAPEAWENTWLESLEILQQFPIPLARHSIEQKNGQKRHVYNHYDALNQWGAQDIMRTVLELSGDVEELIAFVEQAIQLRPANKKAFEWTDVLKMLCGDYIFVNPVERETLKHIFERGEDMPTIDDVFSRLFLKMAGMPYISPLYVPADELLESFALRDPKRGYEYHDIIQNYQQKLAENTVLTKEVVHNLEERLESSSNYQQAEERKVELVEAYAPHEQYIIRQAIQQQDQFGAFDQNISAIAPGLQELIGKYPMVFNLKNVETYLQKLNQYTFDAGFGISESAWAQIDQTRDIEILKRLLALAAVDNQERSFWRWRKHIFETPELWPQLLVLEERS